MELLYYSRQWPGTQTQKIFRFIFILFLEIKRVVFGKIYIAEFDLTDECNLRCKHCYHFRENCENIREQKTLAEWKSKFKELHKKGIRRILLIGGEPALRQDVIREAIRFFKYIDICSNGTIKIGDYYKQKIFVSIDGEKEYHDSIRGNGIFDIVLSNYSNDRRVVLSMTITEKNWQQLEYVINLAIQKNLLGVSCDIYTPSPKRDESDLLFLNPEVRKKVINEFKRLKKKYPRHFLMSNSVISWYENPNHLNQVCYWRSAVIHYNAQLEQRLSCKDLDCANCGHFAQANLSPLNFLISKKN